MATFKVKIITPQDSFADKEVESAGLPGFSGRLTLLANHTPLICRLKAGKTVFKFKQTEELWETGIGILTVEKNTARLLVHTAALVRTA